MLNHTCLLHPGVNDENCQLLNKSSGAIDALVTLCMESGDRDWEIVVNTALALSTSSSDETNRIQLAQDPHCMTFVVGLLTHFDPEVQVVAQKYNTLIFVVTNSLHRCMLL